MKKVLHSEKEARSWLSLEGPVLKWFKDSKRTEIDQRGSIPLDYVNVGVDPDKDDRFWVSSSLPKVSPS